MTTDTIALPSKADLHDMGSEALLLLQLRLRAPGILQGEAFETEARGLVERWERARATIATIEDAIDKLLELPEG